MNLPDVAILLGVVGTYDLRIQVDELKIRAWHESLDRDMDLDFAKRSVYSHYSNSEVAITVAHINRQWRKHREHLQNLERNEQWRLEREEQEANKASQEIVNFYLSEIRKTLKGSSDALLENDNGQVAPNE